MTVTNQTSARKCLPLPQPESFDYCAIAPEHAADLRQRAARIREQVRVTTVSAIEIGNELLIAKQHLPHGQFEDWVRAECGCGVRTARNYMAAAAFAEGKSATVADLPPSVVYKLAAKSTPPELAVQVIERAAAGKVVDPAAVKAVLQFAAHERRQCEAAHERNTRRSAAARRQREARERLARLEQETKAAHELKQQIIERLGIDNVRFFVHALAQDKSWTVLSLLKEVVKQYDRDRVVDHAADEKAAP